jgi:D-alanyl-D-alanine carboxypeptidase/D-alanyl-D-alanine-endopeptidase (penicillin-binding protein 4)
MKYPICAVLFAAISLSLLAVGCGGSSSGSSASTGVPADIKGIFNKPMYKGATWGLRVLNGNKVLIDFMPKKQFEIGSVRKIFSVGELMNDVGPTKTYDTPVYRQGNVSGGVLDGDLIIVASGDLTMGGRTNSDRSIAITDYDHNEANSLMNAQLTTPNPIAGYIALANQVAAAGITHVTGEIAVDDRLFQPYHFRGEFDVRPIFVNDDVVDMSITPTTPGSMASLVSRPVSAALASTTV